MRAPDIGGGLPEVCFLPALGAVRPYYRSKPNKGQVKSSGYMVVTAQISYSTERIAITSRGQAAWVCVRLLLHQLSAAGWAGWVF